MDKELVWIVAGEASGDLYGAELARALRERNPQVVLRGMGGDAMRRAGVDTFVDSSELGVVGIVEVLKSLLFFMKLLKRMASQAREERPDVVVLIDYPGFNLRLAEKLHEAGIKVAYFISPQVWAWKKGRIPKIARCVDAMMCIFPFEPQVYAGTGLNVEFVGHPLLELLEPYLAQEAHRDDHLVALLPGSRSSEMKAHLKVFMETATLLHQAHPELRFAMPLPREKTKALVLGMLETMEVPKDTLDALDISVGNSREVMRKATAGLAASGTVTVEAAILGLPLVVTYRVNWLTYQIAKRVVKLPSITIANLVTGKMVFKECLQYDATAEIMAPAIENILPGGKGRQDVLDGIKECVELLGGKERASARAAEIIDGLARRGVRPR